MYSFQDVFFNFLNFFLYYIQTHFNRVSNPNMLISHTFLVSIPFKGTIPLLAHKAQRKMEIFEMTYRRMFW
jgi:hypothetical protein